MASALSGVVAGSPFGLASLTAGLHRCGCAVLDHKAVGLEGTYGDHTVSSPLWGAELSRQSQERPEPLARVFAQTPEEQQDFCHFGSEGWCLKKRAHPLAAAQKLFSCRTDAQIVIALQAGSLAASIIYTSAQSLGL